MTLDGLVAQTVLVVVTQLVTMLGRCPHRVHGCELPRAYGADFAGVGAEAPEEARQGRGQALELDGLVDAGGLRRQPGRWARSSRSPTGAFQQDAANQVLLLLGFSAFMVVGALVVAHRPGNAIGWIFSAIALLAVTGQLASEYAVYAYATRAGSLPGAILAAWYGSWPWWLVLTLTLVFTPLLFPTGRLLSPRWRPVAWLAGAATAVLTVLACAPDRAGRSRTR